MSTVNGHQTNPDRDKNDFYPTDKRWTEVLFRHESFVGEVMEPCAGDGSMLDVIKKYNSVKAGDIAPRRDDIPCVDVFDVPVFHNVITNPPYNVLLKLMEHVNINSTGKVALLVRINFLEGKSRLKWTSGPNKPKKVIVIAGRMPVFGKTSQFPHCWVVWDFECPSAATELVVDTI